MSPYDRWKTTNPADEEPELEYPEDFDDWSEEEQSEWEREAYEWMRMSERERRLMSQLYY